VLQIEVSYTECFIDRAILIADISIENAKQQDQQESGGI